MSVVEYWSVGAAGSVDLPMANTDISTHLAADWIPSFPTRISSLLVGWPSLLTELVAHGGSNFMALRPEMGRSEKQWKGFLSWMLGVAGTRHVLRTEGYRWIAPLSAFYANATKSVDLTLWHPLYPKSLLTAVKPPASTTRFMPDYVALRPRARGRFAWALAEAKGTDSSLAGMNTCPQNWRQQVTNANLLYGRNQLPVSRHLVVATRCNPGASKAHTRRIQVRAWNHEINPVEATREAAIEIVAAHLFGLVSNLGLRANARALAVASQVRRQITEGDGPQLEPTELHDLNAEADRELQRRLRAHPEGQRWSGGSLIMPTVAGEVTLDFHSVTLSLLHAVRTHHELDRLTNIVGDLDDELGEWETRVKERQRNQQQLSWDPIGIEAKFQVDEG